MDGSPGGADGAGSDPRAALRGGRKRRETPRVGRHAAPGRPGRCRADRSRVDRVAAERAGGRCGLHAVPARLRHRVRRRDRGRVRRPRAVARRRTAERGARPFPSRVARRARFACRTARAAGPGRRPGLVRPTPARGRGRDRRRYRPGRLAQGPEEPGRAGWRTGGAAARCRGPLSVPALARRGRSRAGDGDVGGRAAAGVPRRTAVVPGRELPRNQRGRAERRHHPLSRHAGDEPGHRAGRGLPDRQRRAVSGWHDRRGRGPCGSGRARHRTSCASE